MAASGSLIYIYSNDGLTKLTTFYPVLGGTTTVTITDTGAEYKADSASAVNSGTYTYSGDKVFIGLATSANASGPTYAVGDKFTFPAYASNDLNLYIVEEELTPPTKIKSPVIVIKQKVKQVVIDNANMTIDIYTNEVPKAMATVTITNTATTGINAYVMEGIDDGGDTLGYLNANSSITIEVELGSIISVVGDYNTSPSYMAGWRHTSLTGDIVLTDSWWGQGYIINSGGTITGYSYDSD